MQIFVWVLFIIGAYLFIIFFVSRLVVRFMGFRMYGLPEALPEEIRNTISTLENQSADQQTYLQAVYDVVLNKTLHQWQHTRFKAATRLPRAFVKDLNEIWRTNDFLYCTSINYLIFVLLAGSQFFKAEDIRRRHVFVNIFIHQYLQVRVNGKWIDVDPAGTGIRGKPLGQHLSWLG